MTDVDPGIVAAAVLALVIACSQWWAYFDVVAVVAEHRFRKTQGHEQVRIARDSYSYLHLPMIAGIVLIALGVKKTVEHVDEPLKLVPAVGLFGGIALYYAGHIAFRLRNMGTLNRQRLVAALLCLALIPLAVEVDALIALAIAATVTSGLVAYDALHFAESRRRMRSVAH